MKQYTAAERRFFENATLIGAQRVIFGRLADMGVPVFKLSELAETTSGGTPDRNNSTYYGGSIRWMKSGELTDGFVTGIEETITESGLANSNAKVFPVGTLLIALYGATVGKTGILGVEAATNQAVCAVTPKRKDARVSYLFWFLRRKREDFLQTSFGGAQPNISQKILRDTLVPLPSPEIQDAVAAFLDAVEKRMRDKSVSLPQLPAPLVEQRRVVARIEELAAQIHEARTLRHQAAEEAEALIPRSTSSLLDDAGWPTSELGKILAQKPRNGLGPQPEADSGGRVMLRINAVSSSPTRYVDMTAAKQVQVSDETAEQFVIRNDDVFIVRYNGDINRVAKPAIYKGANEDRVVYPDKLIRLRTDSAKMTPDFLVFALNSRSVRTQIEELGKTTAGNIGVSGGDAQSFVVPVPPLAEQRRIVAELDALQAEVDALKRLQVETAAELDALLPAILDRAFKGEL